MFKGIPRVKGQSLNIDRYVQKKLENTDGAIKMGNPEKLAT